MKKNIIQNKLKIPFYKRFGTIILTVFTSLTVILGAITEGFQVWDKFSTAKPIKKDPFIDFRIEPFEYNYNENKDYGEGSLNFTIQTSNGSYQILDNIKFDTLVIIHPDYFVELSEEPKFILKDVILDRMILDSRIPEEMGIIRFENNFVLKEDKFTSLSLSKKKETIAYLILSIPYKYENEIYTIKKKIPILVYCQ